VFVINTSTSWPVVIFAPTVKMSDSDILFALGSERRAPVTDDEIRCSTQPNKQKQKPLLPLPAGECIYL